MAKFTTVSSWRARAILLLGGLLPVLPVYGSFHAMQIEQVIGGVDGDATVQAIQLRERLSFQNLVSAGRLRVSDAAGMNPITVLDVTTNVSSGTAGARILIASANFASHTSPTAVPDFIMTTLIPESYLAAGSLTWESDAGIIYWRLSWGGTSYTGTGTGNTLNDTDGNFNPPFDGPCPTDTAQAILFDGAFGDKSTNNKADYILTAGDAVFRNNAGTSFTVFRPDSDGDGVFDSEDVCPGEDDNLDTDSDEAPDCLEGCPDDPEKTEPGICGCGVSDNDSDGDGTADCLDGCADDPNKTEPGACGCGVADADSDGDTVADCVDNCPEVPNSDQADVDGNGIGDACEKAPCEGDANDDGSVDPLDSGFIKARFGCPVGTGDPDCDTADQNGDGAVDPLDDGYVLARFGDCP